MTLRQQIKILCAYAQITQKELATRFGNSPQNFANKITNETLSVSDLKRIAELTNCEYKSYFVLPGEGIIE